jgi:hypothetical protein
VADLGASRDANAAWRRPARRARGRRILGIAIGSAALWGIACGENAVSNETANGLFAAGDYAGALAEYRNLQLDLPDSPELAVNAANAMHKLAQYPQALPEYGKAIDGKDLKIRATAQYDRGNTLFRMGRFEDARERLPRSAADRSGRSRCEVQPRDRSALLSSRPAQPGQQPGPGQGQPGSPIPARRDRPGAVKPSASACLSRARVRQPQEPTAIRRTRAIRTISRRRCCGPRSMSSAAGSRSTTRCAVLDALQGEQRGVGQLLEGPRKGSGGEY